jgi:dihydrolipoamide dehydrogenase
MPEKNYDVIVIGGGPAGYVAAIRCAQLGLSTACIDAWKNKSGQPSLGGTCLNVGCIPSKALLDASEHYHFACHEMDSFGINAESVSLDIKKMLARKDNIVSQLTQGISGLFKANHIDWLQGTGKLLNNKKVEFTAHDADPTTLQANNVILASGSRPIDIQAAPVDNNLIVDSSGALEFNQVPKTLGIIGAGVIGLELGSVWNRLGSDVTLLEAQTDFLPILDSQISREALKQMRGQGLKICLGARVISAEIINNQVKVSYQDSDDECSLIVDKLVVAVGRTPNSNNLFSQDSNLLLDENGFVHVDEYCVTNLPGVYAIGDLVRGPMLAHKGSEEGVAVAETIAGQTSKLNLDIIPSVIYTHPEIACVGLTETSIKASGREYKMGFFPFAAIGRAHALGQSGGMVKILADAKSDKILGVHIIGPSASELIAEAVLAMEYSASSEDLARTIHAHPTLSEALHEAALAVDNRAIHKANRKTKK